MQIRGELTVHVIEVLGRPGGYPPHPMFYTNFRAPPKLYFACQIAANCIGDVARPLTNGKADRILLNKQEYSGEKLQLLVAPSSTQWSIVLWDEEGEQVFQLFSDGHSVKYNTGTLSREMPEQISKQMLPQEDGSPASFFLEIQLSAEGVRLRLNDLTEPEEAKLGDIANIRAMQVTGLEIFSVGIERVAEKRRWPVMDVSDLVEGIT